MSKLFKTCETNGHTLAEKSVSQYFSLFLSVGCGNNPNFIYLNEKK